MKVAIFTDTFLPQINGVTKNLSKQLEFFEKEGISYQVFAPDFKSDDKNEDTFNTYRVPSLGFFLYPECRLSIPHYYKIKRILKEYDPDIIHTVTQFNLGLCGLKYANKLNIPLINSYHTNFSQYLHYYSLKFLKKPVWSFLRWFHNQGQYNLCPSQITKKELKNKGIKNLKVVTRGINHNKFSPIHRDQRLREKLNLKDKLCLLYVGRLAPEKNIEILIDSIKKLNENYKNKIKLVLTGDGPSKSKLIKMAPDNVHFTGYLTGQDLEKIYASADIFTFSSITETYGNVILEAMSSGLPVVAMLEGGVKENLVDEYNGLACYNNNVEELTGNIERLITNTDLRQKLAKNARKYALSQTWDKVYIKLINIYQEAIKPTQNQKRKKELGVIKD